jgi:hypothetical protein
MMDNETEMVTTQVMEQQRRNEEFSIGAPVPAFGCSMIISFGREMRTPHDCISFAGTEMAIGGKLILMAQSRRARREQRIS